MKWSFTVRKTRGRRYFLDRFRKEVIGTTRNADFCRILNPEVLEFNEVSGTLYVRDDQPIRISNDALGYIVNVHFITCKLTNQSYEVQFIAHFNPSKPSTAIEDTRWQINRVLTYQGSPEHFFRSLEQDKTGKEGYKIYRLYSKVAGANRRLYLSYTRDTAVIKREEMLGRDSDQHLFVKKGLYEIHFFGKNEGPKNCVYFDFPYPVSRIEITDTLHISPDGVVAPPTRFVRLPNTYMDRLRLGDLLPADYQYNLGGYDVYEDPFKGTVSGKVTDTHNRPLRNAHLFINGSMYKGLSDSTGHFTIHNVPVGTYDLVLYSWNKQILSQKIIVSSQPSDEIHFSLSPRNWTEWGGMDPRVIQMFTVGFSSKFHHLKLTNPEVLEFKEVGEYIYARSRFPLEFENKKLGYTISYFFDSTRITHNHWNNFSLSGFTLYDTLASSSANETARWQRNRFEYYKGTEVHFFHALAEGRALDEGFRIFQIDNQPASSRVFTQSKGLKYILLHFSRRWSSGNGKQTKRRY